MLAAPYLFAYLGFKNPSNIKTSCFKNLECWDSKTFRFLYWDLKTIASQSTIFLLKNDTSIQWISSIFLWDLKTKLLGFKNLMLGFKNLMLGFKNRRTEFILYYQSVAAFISPLTSFNSYITDLLTDFLPPEPVDNFADKRGADHPGTCKTYPKANRAKFNLGVTVLISAPDDIALPRTDRLAALPLPNPFLRRALRSFWLDFFDSDGLKRHRSDFLVKLCLVAKKWA